MIFWKILFIFRSFHRHLISHTFDWISVGLDWYLPLSLISVTFYQILVDLHWNAANFLPEFVVYFHSFIQFQYFIDNLLVKSDYC